MRRRKRSLMVDGFCIAAITSLLISPMALGDVKINEIRIAQPADDYDEYFELIGNAGESLEGMTYIVIGDSFTGGSGVVECVVDLSGHVIPADFFFLVAEDTFSLPSGGVDLLLDGELNELNFEHYDNKTHVLVSDFTGAIDDDLDTDDDGVLDVTPWSTIHDMVALVEDAGNPPDSDWYYGTILVGPDGTFVPGHIFRLGTTDEWAIGPFDIVVGWDTPGDVNPDDADEDGVPDHVDNCYLYNPNQEDCNQNDIGDPCDIDSGYSLDENQNGIPDECENLEIVINEVLADPGGNDANQDTHYDGSDDEFVEITNFTGAPLDVTGWEIWDGFGSRHVFPEGSIIENECSVVVFGGGTPPPNYFHGALVQTASSGMLGLNNSGDRVTLYLPDLVTVIDEVIYDEPLGGQDQSFTRDPDLTGPFVLHSQATGSGGSLYSPGAYVDGTGFGGCSPLPPDSDGDGWPDDIDNCYLYNPDQADCNENLVGDVCDIDAGTSQDCQPNGIPDECEEDCNQNGIPDDCDILYGTSDDCNLNGIPDECEEDCNGNGVPDDCDVDPDDPDGNGMVSPDCNLNGTPDECEDDCNGNGVPDDCDVDPDDPDGDGVVWDDENSNGIPDVCEVSPPDNLVINELRRDQPGTDNDEYFELKGDPGTDLFGITYVVIGDGAGGSGTIEAIVDLSDYVIPADGLFLAAESTFTLRPSYEVDYVTNLNFENNDNVTHLLVTNFYGTSGDDLDTDDDGTLDILPWGDIVDAVGLILEQPPAGQDWAYGLSLGYEDVGPDGTYHPAQIYRCTPDDTWTIGNFDPFTDSTDTPGETNLPCEGGNDCPGDLNDDNTVDINDIFALLGLWGACPDPCPPYCFGDLNEDCFVDINDIFEILGLWGPCPE